MHLKCQKRIEDYVGDVRCFYKKKLNLNLKFLAPITKVNEGESNTPGSDILLGLKP
jgi:hypothetical protein